MLRNCPWDSYRLITLPLSMFSILPDIETADCARSGRIEISGSMKANVFRFMVRLIHGKVNLMSVIVKWALPVLWREMRDESGDMTMGYPPVHIA